VTQRQMQANLDLNTKALIKSWGIRTLCRRKWRIPVELWLSFDWSAWWRKSWGTR
jgi:hypothetical protein